MIDVVYAVTDFPCEINGAPGRVRKGSHWPADDPMVRAHPGEFSRDPRWGLEYTPGCPPDGFDDPVEQAPARVGRRS